MKNLINFFLRTKLKLATGIFSSLQTQRYEYKFWLEQFNPYLILEGRLFDIKFNDHFRVFLQDCISKGDDVLGHKVGTIDVVGLCTLSVHHLRLISHLVTVDEIVLRMIIFLATEEFQKYMPHIDNGGAIVLGFCEDDKKGTKLVGVSKGENTLFEFFAHRITGPILLPQAVFTKPYYYLK